MAIYRRDEFLRTSHLLASVLDYGQKEWVEQLREQMPIYPVHFTVSVVRHDSAVGRVTEYAKTLIRPGENCLAVWHVALALMECQYPGQSIDFCEYDRGRLASVVRQRWGVVQNKVRVLTRRRDSHGG